jgi:hypothetical protein
MSNSKVFQSIPCLTENSPYILGRDLFNTWFKGGDKRHIEKLFYEFISINSTMFNFLGVSPQVSDSKSNIKLTFRTSNFIGAIPLRSPVHGREMGDFIVHPRYLKKNNNPNEYIQLIYLLQESIEPEFNYSYKLISRDQAKPPLFYECIKFIKILFLSTNEVWNKFSSLSKTYAFPKGKLLWKEYIKKEWNPEKRITFPCKINQLSTNHLDNQHIKYVYELAKENIYSYKTPSIIKNNIKKIIPQIDIYFREINSLSTSKLKFRNSDPQIIKDLKKQGNKILDFEISGNKAWRIDFSLVFERYVQHIFQNVSNSLGLKYKNNPKIRKSSSNIPSWSLQFLEPDMYIFKEKFSLFLDAKYKSHFYNLSSRSDFLTEEHRLDLHQISAYCAFNNSDNNNGLLVYPANSYKFFPLKYNNSINGAALNIYLIGVPISSQNIRIIENQLLHDFKTLLYNR